MQKNQKSIENKRMKEDKEKMVKMEKRLEQLEKVVLELKKDNEKMKDKIKN